LTFRLCAEVAERADPSMGRSHMSPDEFTSDRESRLARSLKRLGHRLEKLARGGFAIADDKGKIVQSGTAFSPTMTLDDVHAWIEEHIERKDGAKPAGKRK
jgi:hypothetical protein